jgi:Sec-independent protein translocase protein TatA
MGGIDFNLLGIGPFELLGILALILILFNPKDIGNGARRFGALINRLTRSENFRMVQQASREIQSLPQRLAEEAQLEEVRKIGQEVRQDLNSVNQSIRAAGSETRLALDQATGELKAAGTPANPAGPASSPAPPPAATPRSTTTSGGANPFAAWTQPLPAKPDDPPPAGGTGA